MQKYYVFIIYNAYGHHVQELFGGVKSRERTPSERQITFEALLPDYAARLSRKGVTVKSLYEEYAREHPDWLSSCEFRYSVKMLYAQHPCHRTCGTLCR